MKATMKKVLSMLLVVALTAGIAISGTIAYLTSEDSDVNVMTMGNVSIEQLEYERVVDENGNWISTGEVDEYTYTPDQLQEFTQGKPALPAVYQDGEVKWDDRTGTDGSAHQQSWAQVGAPGSNQLFDDSVKNVIDKFVFVENTGKTDAYYRTIIAVESPEDNTAAIHLNTTGNSRFAWESLGNITVDGVRYDLKVATYNEVLTPGEISRPSLLQIFLDPSATNEDCATFGTTWDVLVLSQAVQADGFANAATALDTAFGKVSETAAEWFGADEFDVPTVVSTADELKDALANGGSIMLAKDIVVTEQLYVNSGVTVNLDTNGYSLTREETNGYVIRNNGGTLTVDGEGSIGGDFGAISTFGGTTVINSGNFYANGVQGNTHHVVFANSGAELIINGGTFAHNGGGVSDSGAVVTFMGNSNVTINGGTFTSNATYIEEIANWGGTLTDNR